MGRAGALLILAILLLPLAAAQEVSDPELTGSVLSEFQTLQLRPGESGDLAFNVTNPYPWALENATLGVEIHEYRVPAFPQGLTVTPVRDLERPPVFAASNDPALRLSLGGVAPASTAEMRYRIVTEPGTPGGSVFTQGTYVVRFRLAFAYDGGETALLLSPGFFTAAELAYALRDAPDAERAAYRYVGFLNLSFLSAAYGEEVDGLLPDTAFGVKVPLPLWPFVALLVGSAAAFGLSLYYLRRERQAASKPINRRQE